MPRRERKLENYPTKTLVKAFIDKWKLDKVTTKRCSDIDRLRELGLSVQETNIPIVIEYLQDDKTYYYIVWRAKLISKPYIERLTKEAVLHPHKELEFFKLKQLEEAAEWGRKRKESKKQKQSRKSL